MVASSHSSDKNAHGPIGDIADTAHRTRSLLLCCIELGDEPTKNSLGTQLGRFNLWASNIGVFAAAHASLDYRLRTAPNVAVAVIGNLEILSTQTLEVIKAGGELADEDLQELSEKPLNEVFTWAKSTGPLSDAALVAPDDKLESIASTITALHQLSLSIRKAGGRNVLGKASTLFDHDQAYTLIQCPDNRHGPASSVQDVRYEITQKFRDFVHHVLRMRWMSGKEHVATSFDDPLDDYRQALLGRCVEAISTRRRQLAYFQKHQYKLANDIFSGYPLTSHQILVLQRGIQHVPSADVSLSSLPLDIQHDEQVLSETVPSEFQMAAFRPNVASTIASSTTSSEGGALRNTGWFEVPPPPTLDPEETEKTCPYCSLILPRRVFSARKRAKAWRQHLVKDLQPYICLFSNCSSGAKGFRGFKEWQRHMDSPHEDSWVCPLHSDDGLPSHNTPGLCFSTPSQFRDHLRIEHAITNDSHVQNLLRSASVSAILSKKCFVCLQELSTKLEFQKHIAHHLTSAFILALPWRDDLDDDGIASSGKVASHTTSSAESKHSFDYEEDIDENLSTDVNKNVPHIDATGDREVVFCHQCEHEWYRDQGGLVCPRCDGEATEIITPENDPRAILSTLRSQTPSDLRNADFETQLAAMNETHATADHPNTFKKWAIKVEQVIGSLKRQSSANEHALAMPWPGYRPAKILVGYWSLSSPKSIYDKHAVYGILEANDEFRFKVVLETMDGRFLDGNLPTGAGGPWIGIEEVELLDHIRNMDRKVIKEYVRIRQYQTDHCDETEDERVANEIEAVHEARRRVVLEGVEA